jgi:hypothetical protein
MHCSELTRSATSGCEQSQQRGSLFDHLIGAMLEELIGDIQQWQWNGETERSGCP